MSDYEKLDLQIKLAALEIQLGELILHANAMEVQDEELTQRCVKVMTKLVRRCKEAGLNVDRI